jgi:hypothetical protein
LGLILRYTLILLYPDAIAFCQEKLGCTLSLCAASAAEKIDYAIPVDSSVIFSDLPFTALTPWAGKSVLSEISPLVASPISQRQARTQRLRHLATTSTWCPALCWADKVLKTIKKEPGTEEETTVCRKRLFEETSDVHCNK